MGLTLLFLFSFHLMTALIGGVAVFLIVQNLHSWLGTKVHTKFAHKLTVLSIVVLTVTILSLFGIGIYSGLNWLFAKSGWNFHLKS